MKRGLLALITLGIACSALAKCPTLNYGVAPNCPTDDNNYWSNYNTDQNTPSYYWMLGGQIGYGILQGTKNGSNLKNSYKNALQYGAHLGYRFGYNFFSTVSWDHINNDKSANQLRQDAILANFNYILNKFETDNFYPYIGAGLGVNLIHDNAAHASPFAWSLAAGIDYSIQFKYRIGLSYRLIASSGKDTLSNKYSIYNHVFSAHLSLLF